MIFKREPLVVRAAVVGVLTALLHALVVLGVLPIAEDQETACAVVLDALAGAVIVLWSRSAVTPAVSSEAVIQNVPEESAVKGKHEA